MDTPTSCLIVGCGYVGTRLARQQNARQRPTLAIVQSGLSETSLQAEGILTLRLDLDTAAPPALLESLSAAVQGAACVYLAPPPDTGTTDPRVESFLQQLGSALPSVVVYISTTGVWRHRSRTREQSPPL
jgi:hypothetical protein